MLVLGDHYARLFSFAEWTLFTAVLRKFSSMRLTIVIVIVLSVRCKDAFVAFLHDLVYEVLPCDHLVVPVKNALWHLISLGGVAIALLDEAIFHADSRLLRVNLGAVKRSSRHRLPSCTLLALIDLCAIVSFFFIYGRDSSDVTSVPFVVLFAHCRLASYDSRRSLDKATDNKSAMRHALLILL